MAADPRWSQKVVTPQSFGTPEAAAAKAPADGGGAGRWSQQKLEPGVSWATLTGQNMEGTNNAFDTTFWQTATAQDEEQRTRGMGDRWTRKDATGVVVYNDAQRGLKFGDVFLNGQKQGNLREGYAGVDRNQGNEMLARMVLPREVWAKAYESESGKPLTFAGNLDQEIAKVEKANTDNYAKGLSASEFEAGVKDRAKGFETDAAAQAGNVGAGALGGAATGAGAGALIGSIFPVVGTAIGAAGGAIVGGIAGGFGAWFNRDERFVELSQAMEQYELATRDGHQSVGMADALSGYAGYAAGTLNPTRNLVHGAYDAMAGRQGDQVSSYYNVEREGAGAAAMTVVDTAAMVVDGIGAFGSGPSRAVFTAIMGAGAIGSTASVVTGTAEGNVAFNPYAGRYEDIGASGMAQLGASAGIDIAQTALGRGVGRFGTLASGRAAGMSEGGFIIRTAADGTRSTGRLSVSALIPSEAATGLSARMLARRSLNAQGVEQTRENMARETVRYIDNLTTGRKTIATAMVNGFGEGAEEVVQAALGATAFGETPTFRDLLEAARQGFAMGAGMGVAIGVGGTTASARYREASNAIRTMRGEEVLDDAAWNRLTTSEQAQEGTARDARESALYELTTKELQRQGVRATAANIPELQRAVDVARQYVDQEMRGSQDAVEASRLQVRSNYQWAPQDYVVSLNAAIRDVDMRRAHLAQVAAGTGNDVPVEDRQRAAAFAAADERLLAGLTAARAALDQAQSPAARAEIVHSINDALREMWSSQGTDVAYGDRRAASVWGARFPLNAAGSFQLMRLQISPELTEQRADSTAMLPDEILPPTGGDYDGDRFINLIRQMLPDDSYDQLRRGAGQLTSDGTMLAAKPYVIAAAEVLYDSMHRPGTSAFDAALETKRRLRGRVHAVLRNTQIPARTRAKLVGDLVNRLADRQPGAVKKFFDTLATSHAPEMRALAEQLDASPWLVLNRAIEDELRVFQTQSALTDQVLSAGGTVALPATNQAMPRWVRRAVQQSSALLQGATEANKYDIFRLQTVLKYNARREATETQAQERDGELAELIRVFTIMNDGLGMPGEEALFEGTAAQDRTIAWLRDIGREHQQAFGTHTVNESMVLLAGAQVPDLDDAITRRPRSDGEVTLIQSVLHEVITGLRRTYADTLNANEAMAARLSSLDAMTVPNSVDAAGGRHARGGDAFVEVLGAMPIYELLGDQGAAINTYTVRGLRDLLMSLRADVRREYVERLHQHPSYAAERDVAEGSSPFTPYRVLVDNVVQSANQQLNEVNGIAGGARARSSEAATANFVALHDSLRKLANARGVAMKTPAEARRFLENDSALASRVLALVEARGVHAGVVARETATGAVEGIEFPQWIYEVLSEPSTARAEMILLRETLTYANAALGTTGSERLDPYKVNDRILRLWLDLAYRAQDQMSPTMVQDRAALAEFERLLGDPTGTVESFMRALNTDHRFRDERSAPFMPWNRDRSVVEASRYGSGISEVMEGTEMRDALRDAAVSAAAELRNTEAISSYLERNSELLDKLREARDNPRSVNRHVWENFQSWVSTARDLPTMVGASIWIQQAKHINEIVGHMGVKGISPDNVAGLGTALAAQLPTFDMALGQLMSSATSGSMGDVLTDMTQLARSNRTIVLNDGTVVDWTATTAEEALDLLSSPATAGLAARMLGMTAWDYNEETGANSLISIVGEGVAGFTADPAQSLFSGSTSARLRRLMILESMATERGGRPIVPVLLAQQMNIREAAVGHVIDPRSAERETMATEILEDLADSLQKLSTIEGLYVRDAQGQTAAMTPVVDDVDPDGDVPAGTGQDTTLLHRTLLRAGRTARRAAGVGNSVAGLLAASGPLRDVGAEVLRLWAVQFSRSALASGNETLLTIARRITADLNRIDDYASPLDVLVETYRRFDDPSVQALLVQHAAAHGDITRAVPWAADAIARALRPDTPRVSVPVGPGNTLDLPDLTSDQWETVARGVIAFTMHTSYGIATKSETEISAFPSLRKPDDLSAQLPFWDPTFVDPAMDMFAPGVMTNVTAGVSPLLAAQLELVQKMGRQLPTTTAYEAEQAVAKFVMPKRTNRDTGVTSGTTGQWHALLPALQHSAVGAVMASATESAISMAGLNPSRLRMLSATTKQDWSARPDEALLSTTTVPVDQLVLSVAKGDELDSQIDVVLPGGAAGTRPLAQLEGRVVRTLGLTLPDGSEVSLLSAQRFAAGLTLPASAGVAPGEAGVLTLPVLSAAVSDILASAGVPRAQWGTASVTATFWHPESKPAATAYDHSPWFDGVNGRTDAAFSQDSLLGSLFFGLDGVIPTAYDTALGAIKKLTFALQQVTLMPESARRAIAAQGTTDMAGMLRRLTDFVLKQKIDGKGMGADRYNAIYKLLSLMYVVRVVRDGVPVVLSAEQVIAAQAAGEVFSVEQIPEVVGLPLQHLLTLMGERDLADLVVTPTGDLDHSPDVSRARQYTDFPAEAWSEQMFGGLLATTSVDEQITGWATADLLAQEKLRNLSLPKSRVMARTGQSSVGSRDFFSGFRRVQEDVLAQRARVSDASVRWSTQAQDVKRRVMLRQNIGSQVLNAVQLAGTGNVVGSAAMLAPARATPTPTDLSTAWEYVHRAAKAGSAVEGVLRRDNLDGQSEMTPVLGDTVFIRASSFLQSNSVQSAEQIFPEAREVLQRLMGVGATIALPTDPAAAELRGRMLRYLREHGYTATEEGGETFEPQPTAARSQATAAFNSTLNGATNRTAQNRVPISLSAQNHVNENSIISVNGGLGALEDYFVREVAQTARYAGYAPALDPGARRDVINALLPVLRSTEGIAYLQQMSEVDQVSGPEAAAAEREFSDALAALRSRLEAARGDDAITLLPEAGEEFGTGDLIPLASYNADGELVGIHLYRHGHEPVRESLIAAPSYPEGNVALGVAGARLTIDRATVDAAHTTHRGVLVERQWRGLNGFVARVRVPLADLGSKVFETLTGMKWTTTPATDEQVAQVPDVALFGGRPILGLGDHASPLAKTSDGWWLNTPGHIVESVGFDVMPYLVRALTGTEYDPADPTLYAASETIVTDHLRTFARFNGGSIDAASVVTRSTDGLQAQMLDLIQSQLDAIMGEDAPTFGAPADERTVADMTYVRLVLTALATGAELAEVLGAPGYLTGAQASHTMHPVFTTLLHQLPATHPARAAFADQINARMPRGENGIDGWTLTPDLTWIRRRQVGDRVLEVPDMLAFAEIRNTDHNDALSSQGVERKQRGSVSATTSAMAYTTWDVTSLMTSPIGAVGQMLAPNQFLHGDAGARGLSYGRGLSASPIAPRMDGDLPLNSAEREHVFTEALPARRALAVPIDQTTWYEGQSKEKAAAAKRQYQDLFDSTLRALHLNPTQGAYLTEMIRSVMARPAGVTERGAGEFLTHREAMSALRLIAGNARRGDLPTHGGAVNMVSRAALAAMREGGYPLRSGTGKNRPVGSWAEWVDVVLGEAFSSDPQMRGYVAVSNMLDGLLYEYRKDVRGVPASISNERAAVLTIAQTRSGLMVASPVKRREFDAPTVADGAPVYQATEATMGDWMLEELPQSARSIVDQRMASWEKRNGLGQRRRQSPRSEAIRGATVRGDLADTNAVMRFAQLGYVLKSLVNPGLWVSAFLELAQRGVQERAVSFLSGENVAAQGFTPAQRQQWKDTVDALARNGKFYEMVYGNTNFQQMNAQTNLEKRLQRVTTFASAAFNDPTWGTSATTIANRFMEAAWDTASKMPLESAVSVEQFLDTLASNPEALALLNADAVQTGYRRVEYARGLQDNLLERTRRTFVEGIIRRGGPGTNTLGVLLLRFPTLFFRFRTNTIINMLGLQAPHAILTTVLSDRKKRPGGLLDRMRGEDGGLDAEVTDQARIEDSLDITRAIIRSGVSHTQLFLLGSMISAAGFGGGDDDEEKLLNKLRRYQQEPVAQDPLALENDFRNAEAWFADMLPAGMGVPSWITRMFVSPAMGIARFQETGDFRQVLWGVTDALGSMPLLNTDSVLNSWEMANELAAAAEAESMGENVEATSKAQKLLVTSIGTLENMLFESAFASMLYQGADDWDRDPYARVLRDSAGVIQREGVFNTPRQTDAMNDFVDPVTGEIRSGYAGTQGLDAQIRTMTENRPMLAMVMSLIKQDSTYLRYNMVPKYRDVKSEDLDADEAMDLAVSILSNETGNEMLTALGAEGVVRGIHMGSVTLDSPALKNVAMSYEIRQAVQETFLTEMTEKYLTAGYSKKDSLANAKRDFYGQSFGEAEGLGLQEILWGDLIPYNANQQYMQLNTTYVIGPNGRPIATGIERSALQAFGIPPFQTYHDGTEGLGVDQLLNSVDDVRGVNLGMRGLVRVDDSWMTPTAEEIGASITDALEKISEQLDDMQDVLGKEPFQYGSGWRNYGRGGYRRGGGGGYGGSSYVASWGGDDQRLNTPRRIDTPYADDLYSINTSSPIIRRANIRRERFSSQRGRLNQWQ